ncbi:MAG: alanine--tRNA ligase-related protein, partial [Verrucomicrobiales bacterium]
HVDTGMGFERACSIIQCTKNFTDFSRLASNYDTDVFTPIFAKLTEITGHRYRGTVPACRENLGEQQQIDVAFRVIADHIRTTSFAIADGILPGNKGRNSTIRAILRRAVRFGRELGRTGGEPFLPALLPVLVSQFGEVFPELVERQGKIAEILHQEEAQFNRTLDRGLGLFQSAVTGLGESGAFPAATVVKLWETYGFPPELTTVLLQEKGLVTDWAEVEGLVQQHKDTGKEGLETQVVSAVEIHTEATSKFTGFDEDECEAEILELIEQDEGVVAVVDCSPLYVEKGGQLGDKGTLEINGEEIEIEAASSAGDALCLHLASRPSSTEGAARTRADPQPRRGIESHHTATHLLHWALHQQVDAEATQQGSLVAPDRLRFDFNSKALSAKQIEGLEDLVNQKIAEDAPVSWGEVRHADIAEREDIMQFFGDKYGEMVRVVQIGGAAGELDGWSMELCGGTHVRRTGSIGLFKIRKEEAIAAGIRRIDAVCGAAAQSYLEGRRESLENEIAGISAKLAATNEQLGEQAVAVPALAGGAGEIAALEAHLNALKKAAIDADKTLKKQAGAAASRQAGALLGDIIEAAGGAPIVERFEGEASLLQELLNTLKKERFANVAVLALADAGKVHIGIYVPEALTTTLQAGKLMAELAPLVGGRGGGRPEMARGAGDDPAKIDQLLTRARGLLS